MINYFVYELATGEIKYDGICMPIVLDSQPLEAGDELIVTTSGGVETSYVDIAAHPHQVKTKTAYPLTINKTTIVADGVDQIIITNLLNPTKVTWPDGEETIETDGEASFSLDLAGEYTVTLEAIPYLTEVINVTATD
jgi:hypothetical protein